MAHELGNLKYCQICGKKTNEEDSFLTRRNMVEVRVHKACWKKYHVGEPWEKKGVQTRLIKNG